MMHGSREGGMDVHGHSKVSDEDQGVVLMTVVDEPLIPSVARLSIDLPHICLTGSMTPVTALTGSEWHVIHTFEGHLSPWLEV